MENIISEQTTVKIYFLPGYNKGFCNYIQKHKFIQNVYTDKPFYHKALQSA
jgi:hypothetical protein